MSHLRLWQPGDPVVAVPIRVLVGVATYSALDLRLLEIIDRKLEEASRNGATLHVEVFNVLECRDQADFEKYIPGIGTVFQTPVVGIWENGVLVHRATGAAARSLLESRLNTDLDQIES
ncbi:MAG TPA: hypothetical protein VGZ47_10530 [Gemmataceae bacterium]|nr:hypothetical protein [Gemmataceae bacterium]